MSHNLLHAVRQTSVQAGLRISRVCLAIGVLVLAAAPAALQAADPWGRTDNRYDSYRSHSTYRPEFPSYQNNNDVDPLRSRLSDPNSRRFPLDLRSRDPDTRHELDLWPSRGEDRLPARHEPLPSYDNEPAEETQTEAEKIQSRITNRYSDPVIVRFVMSLTADRGLSLYQETARLIDSRHLEPSSYQMRVQRAVLNLMYAVENPAFVQAFGVASQNATAFRQSLGQLLQRQAVNNSNDALNFLRATMDLANRSMRIPVGAVAMEFVSGATESLDQYSMFVPEEPKRQPSASALDDHVVGIGVEIKPHEQGVRILKALRGGPAAAAGLQADDIIVRANGQALAGKSLDFIVDQIGGAEGSTLTLGIVRGGGQEQQVRLVRRRVQIYSVSEVALLGDAAKIGYIKLDKFAQSTMEEVDRALWDLHRQGMQSLIIDLRGNPGGLLTTAVALSDKFLPSGTIVSTRGRNASDNTSESATYAQTWSVPLVVVIDENSASASEIFAAAIQENNRGVIVGRKSYGKGTVQTHFPLQTVSGNLRLTTARFYSPSGRVMAGAGVSPDMPVSTSAAEVDRYTTNDIEIRQALRVAASPELKQLALQKSGNRNNHSS
jgi:carboxyl-terminal processing protease